MSDLKTGSKGTKNRPLISVIIPAYNSEKYIVECIDSVISQTYKNLEIILVDDGSTDATNEICRSYVDMDDRVRLITQENSGQALARNNGFRESCGEYICFVDSDDVISGRYVEWLLLAQHQGQADLSVCQLATFTGELIDSKIKKSTSKYNPKKVVIKNNLIEQFAEKYSMIKSPDFMMQTVPTKLFKRYLLEGIDYSEIKTNILEDNIVMAQTLNRARSAGKDVVAVVPEPLYFYRTHNDSTMGGVLSKRVIYDHRSMTYPEVFYEVMNQVKTILGDNNNIDSYMDKIMAKEFMLISSQITDKNIQINNLLDQRAEHVKQIAALSDAIRDISNSKQYKVGRIIAQPVIFFRKIFKR